MPKLSSNPHTNIHLSNNPHSNIPLLSGQIVAQLNALLFSIHGLTDKKVEAKVTYDNNTVSISELMFRFLP